MSQYKIDEFHPVDGYFALITGGAPERLLAKAYSAKDAKRIVAALELLDEKEAQYSLPIKIGNQEPYRSLGRKVNEDADMLRVTFDIKRREWPCFIKRIQALKIEPQFPL